MPLDCPCRKRRMASPRCLRTIAIVLLATVVAHAQAPSADATQATFESVCGTCHSPQLATSSRRTRTQWLQTVNQMVARGASGSDQQLLAVVEYLSVHYGRVNVNNDPAGELERVGGFSPAEAAAIVEHRRTHGSIGNLSELSQVTGIPVSKLEPKRDALTFGTELPGVGRVPVSALTEANNWPTIAASPQRDGWSREEGLISAETVSNMKLVYQRKLDNQSKGLNSLTSPVILGTLIGYQGFKQMLILGGSSDKLYSIDADLNREIWKRNFNREVTKPEAGSPPGCTPALTAVAMPGSTTGRSSGGPSIRRPGASSNSSSSAPSGVPFVAVFGRTGPVVALASDGTLHVVYQSDGADAMPPLKFVPAGSIVSGLNLDDAMLYGATVGDCGGPNALYAVDLDAENSKVVSFPTHGSGASGSGGTAIGSDGTVYAQVAEGHGTVAGKYSDTVLALSSGRAESEGFLHSIREFASGAKGCAAARRHPDGLLLEGKEIILAGGRDGRLYLLDSASLGGAGHHTPLYRSEPIAAQGSIREAFATWEDPDTNTRWIYASFGGRQPRARSLRRKMARRLRAALPPSRSRSATVNR